MTDHFFGYVDIMVGFAVMYRKPQSDEGRENRGCTLLSTDWRKAWRSWIGLWEVEMDEIGTWEEQVQ